MALNFPINPAGQTPVNTYSPTSSPAANTFNNLTYVFDGVKWASTGTPPYVLKGGDTMSGPLTVPNLNTTSLNGGQLAGLRNRIINGEFRLDQRNVGVAQTITAAAALAYTADRYYAYCTGANVTGQRITVAGTQPDPFRYQFTGAASVTAIGIAQRIEAENCRDLAGKTATLSVNLSNSLLTTVTWTAFYANTDNTFGTLAAPTRTQIATGNFTVNSTYNRYSAQIAIPAAATTGIEIVFTVGAQTSGTWVIGQVQLEEGSVATPFEVRPFGLEEALCQRYFEKSYDLDVAVGATTDAGLVGGQAIWFNGSALYTPAPAIFYKVTKRSLPTIVYRNRTGVINHYSDYGNGVWTNRTAALTILCNSHSSFVLYAGSGASIQVHYTADAEL